MEDVIEMGNAVVADERGRKRGVMNKENKVIVQGP
jgi:hypothetical protein